LLLTAFIATAFTKAFAERLDKLCKISRQEARTATRSSPAFRLAGAGGKQI